MSTRIPIYTDLAGIEGRTPVGASITIGTKGPTGAPIDRDRFYFKVPKQDATKSKPPHPAFAAYNGAAAERRRSLSFVVVHSDRVEWVTSSRIAYRPKGLPPMADRRPYCTGDGRQATRYDHKSESFVSIPCPNERCQYAQGVSPDCKPLMRFYAQPVWPVSADGRALPTVLCELATHSWHSTAGMIGMVEHVETQARHLGVPSFSWYGFTFAVTLIERTDPAKKSKFPVLTFTPTCSIQEWLLAQASQRDALETAYGGRQIAALTDADAHDADTYEDISERLSGPKERA